jgi:hypothetical protein
MSLVRRQLLRKRAGMNAKKHANGITISALIGGYLVSELYQGYTMREATQLFREQYWEIVYCERNQKKEAN